MNANVRDRRKVCFIATSHKTVDAFLLQHAEFLAADYEVTVISDMTGRKESPAGVSNVTHVHCPMNRKYISARDIYGLHTMMRTFRRSKFDAVISLTTKAGVLAAVSTLIFKIPIRIHWFTGQVWVTKRGLFRMCLKWIDKIIAHRASHLLADSASQVSFLEESRVLKPSACQVLSQGSVAGVDLCRFKPSRSRGEHRRLALGIPPEAVVILFLGRLTKDKGVLVLGEAVISSNFSEEVHVVWAGDDEDGLEKKLEREMRDAKSQSHFVGQGIDPVELLSMADILCLPSFREGFGNVIIEAGAMAVPAVASGIYGLTDSVENGVTGITFAAGDSAELAACLELLVADSCLRKKLGMAARERVRALYRQETLLDEFQKYIEACFRGQMQ